MPHRESDDRRPRAPRRSPWRRRACARSPRAAWHRRGAITRGDDLLAALRRVLGDEEVRRRRGPRPAGRGSRASTCTRSGRRASRTPIASATAPPTAVSISSKTRVGAEPRSASATFRARRKRASSPPEATFISGPGRVAGIGADLEGDVVDAAFRRRWPGSLARATMNSARSSLSAGSSAATAFSSDARARLPRRLSSAAALS